MESLKTELFKILLKNSLATNNCFDIEYTFNSMIINVGIIKLAISDIDIYLIFSIPDTDSKNIFFAISENEYKVASLAVAYCEYYTYGKETNFGEYISFTEVSLIELQHIDGIILLDASDSMFLEKYKSSLEVNGVCFKTHLCVPYSEQEYEILDKCGLYEMLNYFEDVDKNFMKF